MIRDTAAVHSSVDVSGMVTAMWAGRSITCCCLLIYCYLRLALKLTLRLSRLLVDIQHCMTWVRILLYFLTSN